MNTRKIRTPIAPLFLAINIILQIVGFILQIVGFVDILRLGFPIGAATWILLLIDVFLCVVLFAKKQGLILAIPVAATTLFNLIFLFEYFSIYNVLTVLGDVLLLLFVLAFGELPFIKADLSKIKVLAGNLFFLPALLSLISFAFRWIPIIRDPYSYVAPSTYIMCVLNLLFLLTFALWLRNPYQKQSRIPTAAGGSSTAEDCEYAYCGLAKHILLGLFTFGIWYLIWTYRTTRFLNKAPNAVPYSPTAQLLLCLFIPFYQIFWYYKHGQRIDSLSRQKNINSSDTATLCLIFGIFVPFVAYIIMQDKINTICTVTASGTKPEPKPEPKPEADSIEQLKKFKELLDAGVITEEEFNAKKKQLLGL